MVHRAEPLLVRVRRSVKRGRPADVVSTTPAGHAGTIVPDGQWRDVVDLMPQVMVVVDDAGRVVQANAAALRVLGDRLEAAELRFLDFVAPTDHEKAAAAWRAPFTRRLGWQVRLDTPAAQAVFSFDCMPLALRDGGSGLAMIGRQLTGCMSPLMR